MAFLLQLIMAHLIGDFFLQFNAWVKDKERFKWLSPYLYIHCIIHGILIILFTVGLTYWKQAVIITLAHYIIDGIKLQFQREKTKRQWFFADQALHLLVIVAVWWNTENVVFDFSFLKNPQILTVLTAIILLLNPASYAIKFFISKWAPWPLKSNVEGTSLTTVNNKDDESLEKAGRIIGMIERTLILSFILLDRWQAIGFLLAAKSIFRFGQLNTAKDRRLTEYVLIGTLVSFFVAIITGIITLHLIK